MPIHTIRLDDIPPQPWRNGGGQTQELLAWPPDAADWWVRVSVARIDQDGPFSSFPGVDRCFAVLEGDGVVLSFGDRDCTLTPTDPPLSFDGALGPGCRLRLGATRDLNLMAARAHGRPAMAALDGRRLAARAEAGWRAVYTEQALTLQVGSLAPLDLPPRALSWVGGELATMPWTVSPPDGGPTNSPSPPLAPGNAPPTPPHPLRAWELWWAPHAAGNSGAKETMP